MKRINLDVSDDVNKTLEDLAKEKDTTKADIIRRALASYAYLDRETDREAGIKVSISNREDRVLKDVILP